MTPRIAVWAAMAMMSLTGLARDPDVFRGDQPPPPPEANPMDIEVPRGGPVWITLSAYSLTSPIIRYRVRRKVQAGKMGTPQMASADTAVVKYWPPAGAGPGEDSFSYQVQSMAGVSVPAEVHIKITDKDPVLVAPTDLDFGEISPGRSARRELVLQNIGGGLAEGIVKVPDGWIVDGSAAYEVGAGAKQSFTLVFTPTEARGYTGDVEYTGDLGRATDLKGTGLAPISVEAGPVELKKIGADRVGLIHVENRTDGAQILRVTAGSQLETGTSVDVPGKGVADIVVKVKAGEEGEISDQVTIAGEGVNADVPVHAAGLQNIAQHAATMLVATPAGGPVKTPVVAVGRVPVPVAGMRTGDEGAAPAMPPLTTDQAAAPVMGMAIAALRVMGSFKGYAPARTYRLETQTVKVDGKGNPQAEWLPFTDAALTVNGAIVTAEMAHLLPGQLYVVRLVGLDDEGKIVGLSSVGQVWTMRAQGGWGLWKWVVVGAVVLAGGWYWRTRRLRG